jgi:hypothetical protein
MLIKLQEKAGAGKYCKKDTQSTVEYQSTQRKRGREEPLCTYENVDS